MSIFEIYLCTIFLWFVCGVLFSIIDKAIDLYRQKRYSNLTKEKIDNLLQSLLLSPRMYASNCSSFEDQVCLLLSLKHLDKNIWHEMQIFKKQHGILSTQILASKYTFESKPNIVEIMKEFSKSL